MFEENLTEYDDIVCEFALRSFNLLDEVKTYLTHLLNLLLTYS